MRPSERARNLIYECIKNSEQQQLPSIRELARMADVTTVTMWRTLQKLKEEKLVTIVPRGGVIINRAMGGAPLPVPSIRESTTRSIEIKKEIEKNILTGKYKPGATLPSSKELCAEFRTTSKTLKAALQSLVNDKKTIPYGRGYRVCQIPFNKMTPLIPIIAVTDIKPIMTCYTPQSANFWKILEKRCWELNFRTSLISIAQCIGIGSNDEKTLSIKNLELHESILGYIVITHGMSFGDLELLSQSLSITSKPVCFFEEVHEIWVPYIFKKGQAVVFPIAINELPGQDIGKHLMSLGHKKIVCIGDRRTDTISRTRISGLRKAVGGVCKIDEMYLEEYDGEVFKADPFSLKLTHALGGLLKVLKNQNTVLEKSISSFGLYPHIRALHDSEQNITSMYGLFASIVAKGEHTAWVCMRDLIALRAFEFLKKKENAKENQIAIVSFDNLIETLVYGITSYDFNIEAVINAMLDHISRLSFKEKAVVEIPGIVMCRESN